jgi:TP901 family phage tail tape measure protein
MNIALGTMGVKIGADDRVFQKVMGRVVTTLKDTGSKMRSMGASMSLKLTAPLAGFAAFAVKEFGEFDQAMIRSTSIMGDMTAQMEQSMRDLAIQMSENSTTSATKLAESYFFLASAGLTVEQTMQSLDVVNRFAIAGQFDMAKATDLLTDAQTALGMSSKDNVTHLKNLTQISDALSKANIQSNANIQQFSEALTNDAAVASRSLGMELTTLMSILDAYAAQGKKGAEAGSLAGRAFRLLASSYSENQDIFKAMGIQVEDNAGNYRNFIDIIADMEKAMGKLTLVERTTALGMLGFEALAQKSILPLLGMSKAMKDWEKGQKDAGGATEEIEKKMQKAFFYQLGRAWNVIKNVATEIGERLAPYVLKLAAYLETAAKGWRGLTDRAKDILVVLGAIVASIGPFLIGLGTIFILGGFVASALTAIITALTTLAALGLPILVGIAVGLTGIALAAAVLLDYFVGTESIASGFETARDYAVIFFKDFLGFSDEALFSILTFIDNVEYAFLSIKTIGIIVWETFKMLFDTIVNVGQIAWNSMAIGVDTFMYGVLKAAAGIVKGITTAWDFMIGHMKVGIGDVIQSFGEMLTHVKGQGARGGELMAMGGKMIVQGRGRLATAGTSQTADDLSAEAEAMNRDLMVRKDAAEKAWDAQKKNIGDFANALKTPWNRLGGVQERQKQSTMDRIAASAMPAAGTKEAAAVGEAAKRTGVAVANAIQKTSPMGSTVASTGTFGEMNAKRIDIAGMSSLAASPKAKQQTEDKGAIEIQKAILAKISGKPPVAVMG